MLFANFLCPVLYEIDVDDIWRHTAAEKIQLLQMEFLGRIISQQGEVNWPPRSCDLTPLDFSFLCFMNGKMYANNPQTIPELTKFSFKFISKAKVGICRLLCSTHKNLDHIYIEKKNTLLTPFIK